MPAACYVQFPRSLPKRHLRSGRASVHRAKRSPSKCVLSIICSVISTRGCGLARTTPPRGSTPSPAHLPRRLIGLLGLLASLRAPARARPKPSPRNVFFYQLFFSVISTWGCGLARTAPHRGSTWSRWLVANASVSNHTRQNRSACASRSCQLQRSAGADQT